MGRVSGMRTRIEIDNELISQAMIAGGQSTARAAIEEGLRLLIQVRRYAEALAELDGLGWTATWTKCVRDNRVSFAVGRPTRAGNTLSPRALSSEPMKMRDYAISHCSAPQ